MHRIDGAGHVNNLFVAEDPATNRPPTEVTADWLNSIQEELCAIVEYGGGVLDPSNRAQVIAKLQTLFSPRSAGAVQFYAMSTAPSGWLKANGAAVSRTTYAGLFAAIGTVFGVGDGATTFNLPDLRGEFLRAWDDARGIDTGRALGSSQAQDIQPHTHLISVTLTGSGGGPVGGGENLGAVATASTGTTETRPRNIALLACIKY